MKAIAATFAVLLMLLGLAACGKPDISTKEGIANAINCANQRQEASVVGVVLACEVGEAKFGIINWTQELEQAYTGMTSLAGGAYAKVGNFLVSTNSLLAGKKAFETLGVRGVFGTKDNNGSTATKEPSDFPTDEGKPNPEDTETPSGEPTGPVEGEPGAEDPTEAEFGETVVTPLGNTVKVTKIRYEKLSETGCCVDPGTFVVVFTVKVTNNGDESLKDFFLSARASYGEDGEEAESVADSEQMKNGIEGTLRKGKSATGEYAFAIPKKQTGDVQLELSYGFTTILFYGKAVETN